MLNFISLQASNADPTLTAVVDYLARHTGTALRWVGDVGWQERERMLDAGDAQVGFICGLPYTRKAPAVELLAAPVPRGDRYGDRPIYFSDVVVRHDSPFRSFADLRGAAWAYNEPGSHSGYNVTSAHLAGLGETAAYFGRIVGSGAHLASLGMVRAGAVDATAIDSTVLDAECLRQPRLRDELRVVAVLGPSPHPPIVARGELPAATRHVLRGALLAMHTDEAGRTLLAQGLFARFAAVTDADYDPVRRMAAQARAAPLIEEAVVRQGS